MASTKHTAHQLLEKTHPTELASSIFSEKVLRKPLHLRPSSPDPTSQDARAQRRLQRLRKQEKGKCKRKVKPLSAKEKRITGIYDVPDNAKKYEIYVPLHRMWQGYLWEILGIEEGKDIFVTAQSKGSILTSADYHGAVLKVVRSKCTSHVGLEGIVIRDTKFTFQIITKKNDMKIIPKQHTIFQFEIPRTLVDTVNSKEDGGLVDERPMIKPNLLFELHGSQFMSRATDRGTKKFKQKYLRDL